MAETLSLTGTSPPHLQEIQSSLNISLQKAMGCFDCPHALQCDLGVPPLEIYQLKEWARMHYRYTAGSAPHITRQIYLFRHQQMNDAREYHLELVIL